MEAMEAILSRRSIRKYTSQPVPEELVNKLLEAAMAAPSAHNRQPWHFVVINERKILDEVPEFHIYSQMLSEAPLAIAVCADVELSGQFWQHDCSAATQNILLAAHALGLGAVWLSSYPVEERYKGLQRLLNLPENVIPLSLISIGYPAEQKPPSNRYNPERVHKNGW